MSRQFCAHCLKTVSSYTTVFMVDGRKQPLEALIDPKARRFHFCAEPDCAAHAATLIAGGNIGDDSDLDGVVVDLDD